VLDQDLVAREVRFVDRAVVYPKAITGLTSVLDGSRPPTADDLVNLSGIVEASVLFDGLILVDAFGNPLTSDSLQDLVPDSFSNFLAETGAIDDVATVEFGALCEAEAPAQQRGDDNEEPDADREDVEKQEEGRDETQRPPRSRRSSSVRAIQAGRRD
jgi:hypothetical protein